MILQQRIPWTLALVLAAATAGRAAGKTASPSPLNLGVSATDSQIFQTDPKHPGQYLWKIWAKTGSGVAAGGDYLGTLNGVTALLFDKGIASAKLKAPHASYDSTRQTIVATGRVMVWSLTHPGTTLQSDRMTWYAKTSQIVATGNVVYKTAKGAYVHTQVLTADTVMKSIILGPGKATMPGVKK